MLFSRVRQNQWHTFRLQSAFTKLKFSVNSYVIPCVRCLFKGRSEWCIFQPIHYEILHTSLCCLAKQITDDRILVDCLQYEESLACLLFRYKKWNLRFEENLLLLNFLKGHWQFAIQIFRLWRRQNCSTKPVFVEETKNFPAKQTFPQVYWRRISSVLTINLSLWLSLSFSSTKLCSTLEAKSRTFNTDHLMIINTKRWWG